MRFALRFLILNAVVLLLASQAIVCADLTSTPLSPARETTFLLRFPEMTTVRLDSVATPRSGSSLAVRTVPEDRPLWLGAQVVLQLDVALPLPPLLAGSPLRLQSDLAPGLHVLAAPDAVTALREAARLAGEPGVQLCRPGFIRLGLGKHGPNAPPPNDPLFTNQWYFEHRLPDGTSAGPDLNLRQAWYWTRGTGIIVAVVDDGVELAHPEFAASATHGFHYNAFDGSTQAGPVSSLDIHSTAVAGLVAAQGNNSRGLAGAAPAARIASVKIFSGVDVASDAQIATAFQHRTDQVLVQNHSWGKDEAFGDPLGPTIVESIAISNAVTLGRQGRGVIMVRSAGNGRPNTWNSNDDGYANDPFAIAVGAIDARGRATDYSCPGANLLVAAPGGSAADPPLATTDRLGSPGWSKVTGVGVSADYYTEFGTASSPDVLRGTSFSAPQVSGIAALLLAVNPMLGWRDVRDILALSGRQFDRADPDIVTNAAGLLHSHNTGFGVPDAGKAVDLARHWVNRPPATTVRQGVDTSHPIPDDALRLLISGINVPPALQSIPSTPGLGPHSDDPTPSLPLVDVDLATNDLTVDLQGKAALIQRGQVYFREKVQRAAAAGALFAVIWNNVNSTERILMGDLDFTTIPAVMIDENSGRALRAQVAADPTLRGRLQLSTRDTSFVVTNRLRIESVQVRLQTTHTRRGDVRVVLRSPSGTRSVLQQVNLDDAPGPGSGSSGWTFSSTRHLGEPGAGTWTVSVSDEWTVSVNGVLSPNSGNVASVEVILAGVALVDEDGDGLDDAWETSFFGNLQSSPLDDADGDGRCNGREQLEQTNPRKSDLQEEAWFSVWTSHLGRLSWPGVAGHNYDVYSATDADAPFLYRATVPGRYPETEWFVPFDSSQHSYFRVRF